MPAWHKIDTVILTGDSTSGCTRACACTTASEWLNKHPGYVPICTTRGCDFYMC